MLTVNCDGRPIMTALSCMLEPSGVFRRLNYVAPARTSGFYVSLGTVSGARWVVGSVLVVEIGRPIIHQVALSD